MNLRALACSALLLLVAALPAGGASAQTNDPVLTLRGVAGSEPTRVFTVEQLEALGTVDVVTATPWNASPVRFTGVPMQRLLELGGPGKREMVVTALNDYSETVPAEQAQRYPIILASQRDGERMPVREKGPLWVIYPLRAEPLLDTPINHARMVWQVSEIALR